jgi:hypothetical protein
MNRYPPVLIPVFRSTSAIKEGSELILVSLPDNGCKFKLAGGKLMANGTL